MKKIILITVATMFLIVTPVMAGSPYISLKGSIADVDVDNISFAPPFDPFSVDIGSSEIIKSPGLAIGYDGGNGRIELEYFNRKTAKYDGICYLFSSPGPATEFSLDTDTFFINFYHDFKTTDKLELYIGVGLGIAKHNTDLDFFVPGFNFSDSNTEIAYNYQCGMAFLFTDNLAFDLGFRYADLGSADVGDFLGVIQADVDVKSKEIILALRYTF